MTAAAGLSPGAARRLGVRTALNVPGVVLFASFFGFGAFARASGFSLVETVFTAGIFAVPGQVVLADSLASGAGLFAAALAVTLTAVRLLPMTVALMPELRTGPMPVWRQVVVAHFVAVTVWVETMRRLPELPREARLPFYTAMTLTLLPLVLIAAALGHAAAGAVPTAIAAGLLFLTPLYFLLSMLAAARERADLTAVALGLVLGPAIYIYAPGLDLLLTGLIGGTLAYGLGRWRR